MRTAGNVSHTCLEFEQLTQADYLRKCIHGAYSYWLDVSYFRKHYWTIEYVQLYVQCTIILMERFLLLILVSNKFVLNIVLFTPFVQ